MKTGAAERFATLDGMRGLAAIAVFAGHLYHEFGASLLPHSYMAVDFFFVLSGFVIAHAYEHRLQTGLKAVPFMGLRLLRLYPLYIAGTAIFAAYALSRVLWADDYPLTLTGFFAMALSAALFLPSPVSSPDRAELYPLNGPAWSLFFELIANIVFALLAPRLTTRLLVAIIVLGFLAQIPFAFAFGSLNLGWDRASFFGGFPRIAFSFFAGVALFRLWRDTPIRLRLPPLAIAGIMLGAFLLPVPQGLIPFYELFLTALFPVLVFAGACSEPRAMALRRGFLGLGNMSYALYMLHIPLMAVAGSVSVALFGGPISAFAPWGGVALLVLVVLAAVLAERLYDRPVRRRLARLLKHHGKPAKQALA